MKRISCGIMSMLLLISMLNLAFVLKQVEAGHISDGEVGAEMFSAPMDEDVSTGKAEPAGLNGLTDGALDRSRFAGASECCCSHYDSTSRKIRITYYFPKPKIEEDYVVPFINDGYYHVSVMMDGLPQYMVAGSPVLPFKTVKILLPFGTCLEHFMVIGGKKSSFSGSYMVEYGQEPLPLAGVDLADELTANLPNAMIYGSSEPFPDKLYSDVSVQSKMGYNLLLLNLYPVEYIPKAGGLSYYESIRVEVEVSRENKRETSVSYGYSQRREIVRSIIDNPEVIETYPVPTQTPTHQYVIITNEMLNSTPGPYNFQALRNEKISRNISATIVTVEWIYANYNGTRPDGGEDNQTKIRNFIVDAYSSWGAMYVLLGGDGDGGDVGGESGDTIIPHRGLASVEGEIDHDIPADMYYGCLDGSFDHDGDGIYGEPNDGLGGGEVDLFAEVYVGRACVDSQTEVQNFIRKTLSYQNTTSFNLRKAWMVGEYLGFGGVAEWGGNYKDEIKEGSDAHGYTTVGFENSRYSNRFDVSTLYDRDYPSNNWPPTEIINLINNNVHLINHLGHANVDYVMKMSKPDVDALTNDELYFIGYSQGCYCGSFDDRSTSPGSYTGYDCISEHLTSEAHGAVAFISNSRYGWGRLESTDGPSQHYDREFWDAILGENMFNIGIANQDSKEDNAGRVGDWVERYCYYEINLFGDPELQIKLPPAYEHELDVAVEAPFHLKPQDSTILNATVRNRGLNNETNVELFLFINGTKAVNATIPELVNGTSYMINYTWTPITEGTYNVTAYTPPVPGENVTVNNYATKLVIVSYATIIGIIETHGESLHTEELADYYTSLGHIVEKITTTITPVVLNDYEIIIVGEDWDDDPWLPSEIAAVEAYISSGKGFLTVGDELAPSVQEILGSYGISYTGISASSGSSSNFDPIHPIMQNVNLIYAGAPVNSLQITAPAHWIANDISDTYTLIAGAEAGGHVLCLSDDFALYVYNDDNEVMFKNIVDWMTVKYEHELVACLDAPAYLEPGGSSLLNATVFNCGLNNETNVEVFLFVNGTTVNNATIPELVNGTSYMINYTWTPITEGTYNVTAYTPPVPGENITQNNVNSIFVHVRYPLINPVEGQYANYMIRFYDFSGYSIDLRWNFTYDYYVEPHKIYITLWMEDPSGYNYTDWMVVDTMNRWVESGVWAGMWYPGWIETDINIGSTVYLLSGTATVNSSRIIVVGARPIDCWELSQSEVGYSYTFWYDKKSGLWIGMETVDPYSGSRIELLLVDTNVSIGTRYEHDLGVSLDAPQRIQPDENSLLNATVYNLGLNNETNVQVQILVNDTVTANITLPQLNNGTHHTINYSWTPTTEGNYNITAYALPVPGENVTLNNIATEIVDVVYIEVALISDNSELLAITGILDSMGIGYDIYNGNSMYLYTEDLDLMLNYKAVIFYTGGRWITSTEHSTLKSYLSVDGNLLVTGFDCLISDPLLADVVRSSSTGDNMGEPDLYVVDDAHPIMNGPYGSFPSGYHISGLYSDCDMAEADTARNAVTVAELADGYDKIIATEGLPGKVVFWNGKGTEDWSWSSDCETMLKNLIHWLTVHYEHELVAALETPDFLEPGDSLVLNATVYNRGLNNETGVESQLLINGTVVESVVIPELQAGSSYTLSYLWTPTVEGIYNITAYAPPVLDENITINNVNSRYVIVSCAVKILAYVQYTDYDQEYANALIAIESTFGPNYLLTELWDYTQLDSMLPGNDILFIPEQENADLYTMESIGATWSTTLSNFLNEGGVMILCDHTWGSGGTYGILTGAGLMSISGSNSITGSTVYLVDPSDPLAEGVSNTFIAPNGALSFITAETNVVFNDGTYPVVIHKTIGQGQIALIGFDYYASNPDADQILGNAVGLWIRYEHDIAVSLEAPTFLEPNDSSLLNVTICNGGLNNETDVDLFLSINDTIVDSIVIPELPTGSSYTLSYMWTPTAEATYNVTAYAPPVTGENVTTNNVAMKMVDVRPVKGYVLFDQTHGTDSISHYSIWMADLADRGYVVDVLTTSPITPSALAGYDIFVVPQAYDYYSVDELSAIQDFVSGGSGFLVIGDDEPSIYTDLTGFAGISWMYGGVSGVTYDITVHEVTEAVTSVYLDCPIAEMLTTTPAVDLVRDISGGIMLAASEQVGRVIGFADEGSLWDYGITQEDNLRLANNMIDWLIGFKYEHELVVSLDAPDSLMPGDSWLLSATVCNGGLNNETDVELSLLINGTEVANATIAELVNGTCYTIDHVWTPTVEGIYNVTAYAPPVPSENVTANNIVSRTVDVHEFPTDKPAVYVSPHVVTAAIGENFTVAVNIFNLTEPFGDLYGFDIRFTWDPTIIEYVNHTITVPVEEYPEGVLHEPVLLLMETVESGHLWFAYASLYPAEPFNNPNETNSVFFITFRVVGHGTSELSFVRADLANDDANPIPHATIDGSVVVMPPDYRDVALIDVSSRLNEVCTGRTVNITVLAANEGICTETFNVTLYANTTIVGVQTISLQRGENTTLTFSWNTTGLAPCSNFSIWAEASQVPFESNVSNNVCYDGWIRIKMLGDLNGDDIIDIYDIILAANAYDSQPGDPNWNPEADVAKPYGHINIFDIVTIASKYGQTP